MLFPLVLASWAGGCHIDRHGLEPSATSPDAATGCPEDPDGDPEGCACTPTSPPAELCDGRDNDCDPGTPDGAEDPGLGAACDGGDDDLCPEGATSCVGGMLVCDDFTGNAHELCNGLDDDCDDATDEQAMDATAWYEDGDADGYGLDAEPRVACEMPEGFAPAAGDCDDDAAAVNPGTVETCNAVDDNCSGRIDDAPEGCGCVGEVLDGTVYWFCLTDRTWTDARDDCATRGATLATIGSEAEQSLLLPRIQFYEDRGWWIGFNDRGTEDTWVWVDGSLVAFTAWGSGEPNDGGLTPFRDEDCAEMHARWNDDQCTDPKPYLCES